jgi:hypothetical protein
MRRDPCRVGGLEPPSTQDARNAKVWTEGTNDNAPSVAFTGETNSGMDRGDPADLAAFAAAAEVEQSQRTKNAAIAECCLRPCELDAARCSEKGSQLRATARDASARTAQIGTFRSLAVILLCPVCRHISLGQVAGKRIRIAPVWIAAAAAARALQQEALAGAHLIAAR